MRKANSKQRTANRRPRARGPMVVIRCSLLALALAAGTARAQQTNPVYTDDSPVARDTLARVDEFVASGNEAEAVRELQRLLDEQPDRVVRSATSGETFVSVRTRAHAVLLASPKLLERYRAAETARATQELNAGTPETVERSRLLTQPGAEACLRVAQLHLEAGGFESARITLEQLENHPDRKGGPCAKDAAAAMAAVARYLNRAEVWQVADRWASEASTAAPVREAVERPESLKQPVASLAGAAHAVEASGLPNQPLWSARVDAGPAAESPEIAGPDDESVLVLRVAPVAQGDTIYINDGTTVAARDRFTLQVRWTYRAPGAEDPGNRPSFRGGVPAWDDPAGLSVLGRTAVATVGGPRSTFDREDPSVFALDVASGKPLWTQTLSRLDPVLLEGLSLRGSPMIEGDTVVLAARKSSPSRRIGTSYLVGLSMEDGSLKWVRPIASAGSYSWGRISPRAADTCLLYQGIVYSVDALGALAAVEAASGRPLWVRPMPMPGGMNIGAIETMQSYQWTTPIADGASLVALAPDRSEVLRIDRATGATLGRRAAGALGDPTYLVRVGAMLAAVGRDAVFFVPIAEFETGVLHRTKPVTPAIMGRVVPAGGSLIVPRPEGVSVVDAANPAADAPVVKLERTGNVLPLESQLLVLDSRQLHSYLTWSVAERLLEDRMTADPGDADPAITYAELAYRAAHPERIASAADKALAAIEKGGSSEPARLARHRLFTVLRDMAEYTEARWDTDKAAQGATPAPPPPVPEPRRRGPVLVKKQPTELPVLEQAPLAEVIDRLGRAAQSPDERVSHLMVLGRLREAEGKPALAAEAYQRILGEPPLAKSSWRGPSVSVRAELEATRRVRQLVLDRGAAAYGPFDAQASTELSALGENADTEALERLARQYPGAAVSGPAWMRAAEQHERAGRSHASVADLREGLAAAETAYGAGSMKDPAPLAEIGGRLVTRLKQLDQLFASAQLLSRLRTQYPELALTDRGTTLDAGALSQELVQKLASLQRLPRIGPEIRAEPQPIAGWSIMVARSRRASASPEHLMMIAPSQGLVGLWGLSGGATGDAAGRVQMLWNRPFSGQPPFLLRIDPESVYLLWEHSESGDGPVIERIAAVTGETTWKTEPFRGLFPADPVFDKRAEQLTTIDTPIDGSVHLTDVLVAIDEQAIALVERSGRAAAFDPATGKMLWRSATAVSNVHDIDASGGAIAIGGAAAPAGNPGAIVGLNPVVLALDARTGQVMHRFDDLANQPVRWVRLAGVGDQPPALVLGLDAQVQCFDLGHGTTNWTSPGGPAFRSQDAWVLGDRLYLLSEQPQANSQARLIYMAPLATGRLGEKPLDTYEQIGAGPIYATRVGAKRENVAFSTTRGVCIFDKQGELVGMDALEGMESDEGGLIPPVASEAYFVTADTTPRQGERGQNVYTIHLLDTQSAALKSNRTVSLELPPKRMAVLDGKILVSAGANTIVYSAPVSDGK